MAKSKPKNKQLTYHQMENVLRDMAGALQQSMERISNLEYGLSSYIEFRGNGKKLNKWMEKRHEKAIKEEEAKNEVQTNEATLGENLERVADSKRRRAEGIRTP